MTTPADTGNAQSYAAAEVRASHRIQCLDTIRAAGYTGLTSRELLDWLDANMNSRSSAQVLDAYRAQFC